MSALPFDLHLVVSDEAERARLEGVVAAAEEAIGRHRYAEAAAALADGSPSPISFPEPALRALLVESWACLYLGRLDEAVTLLERARLLAEGPRFTELDRATPSRRSSSTRATTTARASRGC